MIEKTGVNDITLTLTVEECIYLQTILDIIRTDSEYWNGVSVDLREHHYSIYGRLLAIYMDQIMVNKRVIGFLEQAEKITKEKE